MSTVTAAIKDGYICIASESQTSFGRSKIPDEYLQNDAKLFEWGPSVIGLVGSVSMSMVLQDLILKSKKTPSLSSPEKIFAFFKTLHPKLKKEYFLQAKEDDDDPVETSRFSLLIANKYGLFGVDPMREVSHYNKFWAMGSGMRYALGSMLSVYDLDDFDATRIAEAGVRGGVTFDIYSGGEIKSKTIKLINKK
ncbi:MAG TPA: MFS transporter [Saprospiraceae bacterium]|nr:MFS transporter [Saprospiraceae bacterium]